MSELKDDVVDTTVDEVIVEDTQAEEVIETPTAPLTAARTVSAIQASLAEMSKEGLDAIFEAAEKLKRKLKWKTMKKKRTMKVTKMKVK